MQQGQSWEANSSLASQEIIPMSRSPAHNSCANASRRDKTNSWSFGLHSVQFHTFIALQMLWAHKTSHEASWTDV